ncbi:MAG TPA: hypothetical protein VIY73_02085, partial [Polyangiaceae bacterium]
PDGESIDGSVTNDGAAPETGTNDGASAEAEASTDSGVDGGIDGPADAPTNDDVETPPEGGCTGVVCDGACLASADCTGCPGAPLLCAATRTCGAGCGACGGNSIECFACDSNRQNPVGTCQPDQSNTYCLDTTYGNEPDGSPAEHCGCTTAADCPGDTQVCIGVGSPTGPFACFTCGEADTQTFTCKNGLKCNAQQAQCH